MSDFGPLNIPGGDTYELQAICEGPGGTVFSPSVFITSGCDTAPVFTAVPTGGCLDATSVECFECDGGTITGYQYRASPADPWAPTGTPLQFSTAVEIRAVCVGPGGTAVSSPVGFTSPCPGGGLAQLTRSDPDGVWDTTQATDPSEQFCLEDCDPGASYRWEVMVDPSTDPEVYGEVGWQPLLDTGGAPVALQCIDLSAQSAATLAAANPFDPATQTGLVDLDHTYQFHLRGSCDGGATWLGPVTVLIPYTHSDEGRLP